MQPVVAVFEDLHWSDALTLGLLNELVVAAQNARLLLVVSYRPEYRDEWRNRPNYHQLRLDPLASEESRGTPSGSVGLRPESAGPEELPGGARQRESVLRRRDRAIAGRYRCARGRARQLPPCEAVLEHRGSAHSAGRCSPRVSTRCPPPRSACCRRRRSLDTTSHSPCCMQFVG